MAGFLAGAVPDGCGVLSEHVRRRGARPARPAAAGQWGTSGCHCRYVGLRECACVPHPVSRRMNGDLHPWPHSWRHGWHAAPRPATGTSWAGKLRRRARNAARPGRRAPDLGYGRDLAGQPEAAPGIILSAHHLATADRVGKVTHHATDVSSVRGPRPTRSAARTQVGVTAPRMASVRLPYASLGRGVRSPRRFSPAAPGPGQSQRSPLIGRHARNRCRSGATRDLPHQNLRGCCLITRI